MEVLILCICQYLYGKRTTLRCDLMLHHHTCVANIYALYASTIFLVLFEYVLCLYVKLGTPNRDKLGSSQPRLSWRIFFIAFTVKIIRCLTWRIRIEWIPRPEMQTKDFDETNPRPKFSTQCHLVHESYLSAPFLWETKVYHWKQIPSSRCSIYWTLTSVYWTIGM